MDPKPRSLKFLIWSAAGLAMAAFAVKLLLIQHYTIPQNGMYPALPAGSHLIVYKRAYSQPRDVKRGDVVVFTGETNGRRYTYVWRVVGLPGERVTTNGKSLSIDGRPVERTLIQETASTSIYVERIGTTAYQIAFDKSTRERPPDSSVVVPADQFYVLGDNRFNAPDSRCHGPIPFASIIGKKLWVISSGK